MAITGALLAWLARRQTAPLPGDAQVMLLKKS